MEKIQFDTIINKLDELINAINISNNINNKIFIDNTINELLSREQAAELLKCDLSTLWLWTKKGLIKKFGSGKRMYYVKSELLQSELYLGIKPKIITKNI